MRERKYFGYYNEELKQRYLREKEKEFSSPVSTISVQLKKASEFEIERDKDLCNWTAYEITEYYKMLNIYSIASLRQINSILSLYTQFCIENNLVKDNQNHYLECTLSVLKTCVNKAILDKRIIDRQTVLSWVDQLPNPKDQFILLSLFEYGKSKDFKDIVYAKPEDLNGHTLKLQDRTVPISIKLVSIIENCVEETKYYSMTGKGARVIDLKDYGYIVKSYPNQDINVTDFQKGRNIYFSCQRIFNFLDVSEWMSPNAVSEAGKLYMIKQRAKELSITPKEYVYSDHIKEVEQQFNATITKSLYVKKYYEYLDD